MHRNHRSRRIRSGSQQPCAKEFIIKVLADEHHLGDALFVLSPRDLRGAEVDLFMHTLKEELVISLILECEESLGAEQIGRLLFEQMRHKRVEGSHVQQPLDREPDGGD